MIFTFEVGRYLGEKGITILNIFFIIFTCLLITQQTFSKFLVQLYDLLLVHEHYSCQEYSQFDEKYGLQHASDVFHWPALIIVEDLHGAADIDEQTRRLIIGVYIGGSEEGPADGSEGVAGKNEPADGPFSPGEEGPSGFKGQHIDDTIADACEYRVEEEEPVEVLHKGRDEDTNHENAPT